MSAYNLKGSLEKTLAYLEAIAKETFKVEYMYDGKCVQLEFNNIPKKVVVSKLLLEREYNCLEYKCSRCCTKVNFWNIFTPKQAKNLFKEGGCELPVKVNGKDFMFYVEDHEKTVCKHLKDHKCQIHDRNPIHCSLPLLKFKCFPTRETTYVTREMYGRNHIMQCPVKFNPMTQAGYENTLEKLNQVKYMADELGVKTYIDYIIGQTKQMWEEKNSGQ